jgi:hypothetical protein
VRSKEAIILDSDNLRKIDIDVWVKITKIELLCDIRDNLDRLNQTLIDICQHLEDGITVFTKE